MIVNPQAESNMNSGPARALDFAAENVGMSLESSRQASAALNDSVPMRSVIFLRCSPAFDLEGLKKRRYA
jgi:hypothetical protein